MQNTDECHKLKLLVESLRAQLDAKTGWAESLRAELDAKTEWVESLRSELDAKTEWIESMLKQPGEKPLLNEKFEIKSYARIIAELEESIGWGRLLEKQLAERTIWAKSLEKELEERTSWARSLERQLEDKILWSQSLNKENVLLKRTFFYRLSRGLFLPVRVIFPAGSRGRIFLKKLLKDE